MISTVGFYEHSGDWMYTAGIPAKSGVGGGVMAVLPGVMGVSAFAPPLDEAGNSVKAQLAVKFIMNKLAGRIQRGQCDNYRIISRTLFSKVAPKALRTLRGNLFNDELRIADGNSVTKQTFIMKMALSEFVLTKRKGYTAYCMSSSCCFRCSCLSASPLIRSKASPSTSNRCTWKYSYGFAHCSCGLCTGMVPATDKKRYVATHFIFLLVAIPYQNIIAYMGWTFSPEVTYMLRFIPLVRGG